MKGTGKGRKKIEEVITWAWGHPIRVQILILLNQKGTHTAAQLAELMDESVRDVSSHLTELVERGSVEIAEIEKVGNLDRHWYRAVESPYFSDADVASMTPEQVRVIAGLQIQSMIAEVMAALWAGKIDSDPRVFLAWDWRNVDAQGREEIADEQAGSWERMQQIEVESTNRCAESGEEAESVVVAVLGFPRARRATKTDAPVNKSDDSANPGRREFPGRPALSD